ncbi:hypothetical protein TeGR_g5507 [Tetraparma gracilis]|uniref:Mitochondrial splicing suppressor 51-like C-terminal domain-containing protein n=1 Tax=Tetraparma gracilis TaxID=2962635 RepID=A0ABQ6MHA1_9STRA|nr:hypothetical protein TeGR_g5507 [Tetraparma gracilis]
MDLPSENSILTPQLISALTADPTVTPGLGCCMVCAKPSALSCPECDAVHYCTKACLAADRANWLAKAADARLDELVDEGDFDEEAPPPSGLGHTEEVCGLLRKAVSDDLSEQAGSGAPPSAACLSELASFPATLSNFLYTHPSYATLLTSGGEATKRARRLTVHAVGAAGGAELHGGWEEAYAEALGDVCDDFGLELDLHFVGPDLPADPDPTRSLSKTVTAHLHKCEYPPSPPLPPPSLLVFFNPGFTCEDYSWLPALSSLPPTPFLSTANTEMEALQDADWLLEKGLVERPVEEADEGDLVPGFMGPNPWAGERVRQSGVFGNDVYVKNAVVFGGVMGGGGGGKRKGGGEGGGGKRQNKGLV